MGLIHKLKRTIQKPIIKNIRAKRQLAISKSIHERGIYTPHQTGEEYSYNIHGRNFFEGFKSHQILGKGNRQYIFQPGKRCAESTNTLEINLVDDNYLSNNGIGHIGLGFEKDSLIIEVMQTANRSNKYLNEFRRVTKTQTLNWLLKQAEQRAKELGFKEVKIRTPETMKWFDTPAGLFHSTLSVDEVRTNMKILYNKIAKAEGYKRNGIFYVKKLN